VLATLAVVVTGSTIALLSVASTAGYPLAGLLTDLGGIRAAGQVGPFRSLEEPVKRDPFRGRDLARIWQARPAIVRLDLFGPQEGS
jgi:hypothetical protein